MERKRNNMKKINTSIVYAFIDANNLYLSVKNAGWEIDYRRFRVWLKDKYNVSVAYMFMGRVEGNEGLYSYLENAGYTIKFKPTIKNGKGEVKGNIDADLVLRAMIDFPKYDYAVIVSNDGDFYSLARYLKEKDKLLCVISPNTKYLSKLLAREAGDKVFPLGRVKNRIKK